MTAPRLSAGGVIAGKYTVRNMLGNGGAVITYHCVNQQGQEVAVKLYDPAVASHSTVMKSLEQAYAATNSLPQNSAAPIIDAGYDQPTLAPFSVTELLHLPSLQSQQRRLPPDEVVALLKGLARSLDLAHVRNVVHGAIKPTNVFIGPSCNPIVVTDFGANLAKATVPTQEGFVLSAPWIAPEQAQSGSVTPAADVFSVGLLVFYALTGRTYWRSCQGATFDLNGWQQELGSSRTPASQRAAELGVPLSPTLDIVIWKALSNDPQERYQSVGEFANVLEDSMRGQGAGTAATMALPMVGDSPSPSPLPSNMRNPEGPRPAAGMPAQQHAGASTVALPAEAFLAPGQGGQGHAGQGHPGQGHPGQGQPQMPTQAMSLQQLQAHQASLGNGQGADGYGYGAQQGYGNAPAPAASNPGQYGGMNGTPAPVVAQNPVNPALAKPKNKVIPIVAGFVGVALLGVVITFLFLRVTGESSADTAPVNVDSSAKASASGSAAPATTPTPTQTQTAPPAASSSAPPAKVDFRVTCKPAACDEVKVDGKVVDAKEIIKLDPGNHEVEVSKAGYEKQSEKVDLRAGSGNYVKTFTLVPTAKPVTTGTRPPRPPSTPARPRCPPGAIICR